MKMKNSYKLPVTVNLLVCRIGSIWSVKSTCTKVHGIVSFSCVGWCSDGARRLHRKRLVTLETYTYFSTA